MRAVVAAAWVAWGVLIAANHIRVRRARGNTTESSIRDPRSMHGLLLEGVSIALALALRATDANSVGRTWVAFAFAPLSVLLLSAALRHLDTEWRIKAVVTSEHRLITSGPYALIRHPIYLALLCLVIATMACFTHVFAMPWIGALFLWATSIRIRAEEGLLEQRFGAEFVRYRHRTRSLIPYVI